MQGAKSGVSRVLGLLAELISAPEANIKGCHVLTVTPPAIKEAGRVRIERCRFASEAGAPLL
jgi:hypothetical protein